MRSVVVVFCLILAAVNMYPEGSASRTTSSHPVASTRMEPSLVNEQQAYEWLENWQHRLGLQDWKIEAKIVRIWDLPKGTVANIHWSLSKKTAVIKVLHSVDSALPRSEILKDTELSVVHELVHLSMAKLPLDPVNTELEEEAVKKLSIALLSLASAEAPVHTARNQRTAN